MRRAVTKYACDMLLTCRYTETSPDYMLWLFDSEHVGEQMRMVSVLAGDPYACHLVSPARYMDADIA